MHNILIPNLQLVYTNSIKSAHKFYRANGAAIILDLIQNPEGLWPGPVIPRGSGNPQGGDAMHSIVILDLLQNPQGGETTPSLRT